MIVCTYEDRPSAGVGVKLLVLSMQEHSPNVPIKVFLGFHDPVFEAWLERQPNSILGGPLATQRRGWDVKPTALLTMLDEGFQEVVWLDSDIVLTGDVGPLVAGLGADTLVIAEERRCAPGRSSAARTQRLGLGVACTFEEPLCTCVLRVTGCHRKLLEGWRECLERRDYRDSQQLPFDERDWVLGSDQDVLAGLLGSTEFSAIPLRFIRSGKDIAHCFLACGYRAGDRLRNAFAGLPPLIHAQGPKPWELDGVLFAQLSPYCSASLPYADRLDEHAPWLKPKSFAARALHTASFGDPNFRDLPLVVLSAMRCLWRRRFASRANAGLGDRTATGAARPTNRDLRRTGRW